MVDRIQGSEAGVDAYLVKPLDPEALLKTIRKLCD
jgi:DNA-binding response OmpR family regulator